MGVQITLYIILIERNQQKMNGFQDQMNKVMKSLLSLSEANRHLFQMSELKILNRQQLYRNPFIKDELLGWKNQLQIQRKNIEESSQIIRQTIENMTSLPKETCNTYEFSLLGRIIMRSIQIVQGARVQFQNQYYEYSNKRFKSKCGIILEAVTKWQPFEIIKIIYKHFRHLALVQLERYQQILECIEQTDFQSLCRFKKDFYSILKKTQSKKKVINYQNHSASTPTIPSKQQNLKQQNHLSTTQPHSVQTHKQNESISREEHKHSNKKIQAKEHIQKQQKAHSKQKLKTSNSSKKITVLLNSVMDTKKDHANGNNNKDQKQIYSNLIIRNKVNQSQINSYVNYSQHMKQHLQRVNTDLFYHQEQITIKQSENNRTQQNQVDLQPPQRQSMFASLQPKRKDIGLLSNNVQRNKQHKTIHKSIDCKFKYNPQNVQTKQVIQQKPVKINTEFLDLNLRKILPPKRQSNFDKIVIRASSMGVLKHDLQNRRIQIINENGKMEEGVFKSVKILHQSQFDAQKEAKYQKQMRQKHHEPSLRHDKIEHRIKQQLQHGEHLQGRYHEQGKKGWGDHLVLKKLQII